MSIKIKLTEDQVLVVRVDADQWSRAFTNALDSNSVIEIHGSDGRTLAINPHQILFWEEIPDEASAPQAQLA
ncbi:hypothetical protein BH20ACT16_BH20ACT16_05300 [soil metagenome]|jgi:membrane protein implicated in regulation of membrane protease activity